VFRAPHSAYSNLHGRGFLLEKIMELKFRAFNSESRKMLNWNMLLSSYTARSFLCEPERFNLIVMQFTGLKDKNKSDIHGGFNSDDWALVGNINENPELLNHD
jgi:hypothetical protein